MTMPSSSNQIGLYRDLALFLIRHGRSTLLDPHALDELRRDTGELEEGGPSEPQRFADDLAALGPTFIKLGQLLSTRPDLLPTTYIQALEGLQNKLPPFSFDAVLERVETDLGVRISKAFETFEEAPYAAASLAQVHRAGLRDGRRVAVKVQRPGIRAEVVRDLEALRSIVGWLDRRSETARRFGIEHILHHFERTLRRELDFRVEAGNLERVGKALEGYPLIVIPRPIHDYTSSRVLTMSYIDGTKIDQVNPVVHTELPGTELARELFRAYLEQVLVHGIFHADPHPGNVLLTRDHRIALVDLGMVGHVQSDQQEDLLRLLLALGERDGDRAARIALEMCRGRERGDEETFRERVAALISAQVSTEVKSLQAGYLFMQVCQVAASTGLRLPSDLAVLAKALLNLDQIAMQLDGTFDPAVEIRAASEELMAKRVDGDASRSSLFSTLLEAKDFAGRLPSRLGRVLENVAENRVRIEVDALDEDRLIRSVEKVANRITAGLVLAALIVGAALLVRVETEFTLFGYPGLAILLFLLAGAGGTKLIWDIWTERG